ncbi:hypothetical protein STCU_01527 [Strigomonas culicis]|uniref:PH-like domain-containing protein n=1 Tax=Strigomonas culicis TaxID=28005 RepID=S9WFN3_9TRYP|nr:hypothetical protein STCU_01527 [Strigomonas culicis]|eukprot:EPY34555.1 hypothetical protein STCU_01527 [Strigomonas culicis]
MPPRKETKNRINMRDIISQPLGALANAVDATLRSPEMLDEVEVQSIFHESSFILLRAQEALSARHVEAFSALFKLYSEGLAHSEASFEEGIRVIALQDDILQTINSLFLTVGRQNVFPLHSSATIELVQVVSSLCDGAALKDRCGALFMEGLRDMLGRIYADPEEANANVHLQRAAATALINLVKGSKQNKSRLPSWTFVARACAATFDVFFQLQCVELLFRISRQNKQILTQLNDALPLAVTEKLQALSNDGSLLARMTALIEEMNEGQPNVLRYSLSQVVAADTVLTGSTDAYFTPHYMVALVTSSNADNITIPYQMIRSVTLGKDGRVILKLDQFPVKLEALLSHTAGMDMVSLHMTKERLSDFKQSAVRSWIVASLQGRGDDARHSGTKRPAAAAADDDEERPSKVSVAARPIHDSSPKERDPASKRAKLDAPAAPGGGGPPELRDAAVAPAAQHMMDMIDELVRHGTPETRTSILQLKRFIEAKTEFRRGEGVAALNAVMGGIQERVDSTRKACAAYRTEWVQGLGRPRGCAGASTSSRRQDIAVERGWRA